VWQEAPGVAAAEPMGVSIVHGTTDDDTQIDLTLFGIVPDGFLAPPLSSGEQLADSGWDGAAATWALLASAGLISAGAWLTAASRSRAAIRR